MPAESIRVEEVIPAAPEQIFRAWLDAKEHAKMTGAPASGSADVGGRFSAWDGYIEGSTVELDSNRRIVQRWRTSEVPAGSPDSRVEVQLEPAPSGTKVIIVHTEIPEGQGSNYHSGWFEFYFGPMKRYFGGAADAPAKKAKASRAPAKAKKVKAKAKARGKAKGKAKPRGKAKKPARRTSRR